MRLKLWWVNLSTGKKAGIVFLSSFVTIVAVLALSVPVTSAIIEEVNTHRPVPGTYVSRGEGATATLVLREERDLSGFNRTVDYVAYLEKQYLVNQGKLLVNAFSIHDGHYSLSLSVEKDGQFIDVLFADCYQIPRLNWNMVLSNRAYPTGSLSDVPEEELQDYYAYQSLEFTEQGILVRAFLEPEGLGSLSFEFDY